MVSTKFGKCDLAIVFCQWMRIMKRLAKDVGRKSDAFLNKTFDVMSKALWNDVGSLFWVAICETGKPEIALRIERRGIRLKLAS